MVWGEKYLWSPTECDTRRTLRCMPHVAYRVHPSQAAANDDTFFFYIFLTFPFLFVLYFFSWQLLYARMNKNWASNECVRLHGPARQKAQPESSATPVRVPSESHPSPVWGWSWSRMKINRIVLASTFIFISPRFAAWEEETQRVGGDVGKRERAATWFQYIYICIAIWIVAVRAGRGGSAACGRADLVPFHIWQIWAYFITITGSESWPAGTRTHTHTHSYWHPSMCVCVRVSKAGVWQKGTASAFCFVLHGNPFRTSAKTRQRGQRVAGKRSCRRSWRRSRRCRGWSRRRCRAVPGDPQSQSEQSEPDPIKQRTFNWAPPAQSHLRPHSVPPRALPRWHNLFPFPSPTLPATSVPLRQINNNGTVKKFV